MRAQLPIVAIALVALIVASAQCALQLICFIGVRRTRSHVEKIATQIEGAVVVQQATLTAAAVAAAAQTVLAVKEAAS